MLSSVCETSVPSTIGKRSRTRPTRRATISARDGSPSRAGSVADISTPIIVARAASRRRTRVPGSAARRIACHASARTSIEAHISANATSTQTGVAATIARPIDSMPSRWSASTREPGARHGAGATTSARRAARATRRRPRGRVLRLERGQALRADARAGLGGNRADAPRDARHAALGLGHAERLLVDGLDLARHVRPREALGALARRLGHLGAPRRVGGELEQRLAERHRVADRHEHAVAAVAHDVAVARDVRRHDGGAGGERLGQHHAEALAAERRRAEQVGLAEQAPLLGVVDLAGELDALAVEQQRLDLLGRRARRR